MTYKITISHAFNKNDYFQSSKKYAKINPKREYKDNKSFLKGCDKTMEQIKNYLKEHEENQFIVRTTIGIIVNTYLFEWDKTKKQIRITIRDINF